MSTVLSLRADQLDRRCLGRTRCRWIDQGRRDAERAGRPERCDSETVAITPSGPPAPRYRRGRCSGGSRRSGRRGGRGRGRRSSGTLSALSVGGADVAMGRVVMGPDAIAAASSRVNTHPTSSPISASTRPAPGSPRRAGPESSGTGGSCRCSSGGRSSKPGRWPPVNGHLTLQPWRSATSASSSSSAAVRSMMSDR